MNQMPQLLRRRAIPRSIRGTISTLACVVLLAACDGGPAYYSSARVSHDCGEAIVVFFSRSNTEPQQKLSPSQFERVEPETQVLMHSSLLAPVAEYLYVYIAVPDAEYFGTPQFILTGDFPVWVDGDGYQVYDIHLPAEICPQ